MCGTDVLRAMPKTAAPRSVLFVLFNKITWVGPTKFVVQKNIWFLASSLFEFDDGSVLGKFTFERPLIGFKIRPLFRYIQFQLESTYHVNVKIIHFPLLSSGVGVIHCSEPKTRQHVLICRYGEGDSKKVKSHTRKMRVAMQRWG